MRGSTTLFLLAFLSVGALADLRSDLQAKYRQLDQAISRKDVRAVEKWIAANTTSDFVYTSHDKNSYRQADFLEGLRQQIAITRKVMSATTKVASVKTTATGATVVIDSDTTALVTFDTQPLKLVDKSRSTDTWVKVGTAWRLKRSVQTKSDTQMFKP